MIIISLFTYPDALPDVYNCLSSAIHKDFYWRNQRSVYAYQANKRAKCIKAVSNYQKHAPHEQLISYVTKTFMVTLVTLVPWDIGNNADGENSVFSEFWSLFGSCLCNCTDKWHFSPGLAAYISYAEIPICQNLWTEERLAWLAVQWWLIPVISGNQDYVSNHKHSISIWFTCIVLVRWHWFNSAVQQVQNGSHSESQQLAFS